MKCKNCGLPIERHEYGTWYHSTLEKEVNIDGADVMVIVTECPDDQGEAEPEPASQLHPIFRFILSSHMGVRS